MHNLDELTIELKKHKRVHLETSGAYNLTGIGIGLHYHQKKKTSFARNL